MSFLVEPAGRYVRWEANQSCLPGLPGLPGLPDRPDLPIEGSATKAVTEPET